MDAVQQDALRPHHLRNYTAAAGVTDEQYVQFVTSDAFADVPIVWLGVALLTRMMTAHSTRRIKQGDATDIDAMAAYLPYCDVYGADRSLWKILLNTVAGRNEDRQPRHIDPKRVVKLR